MLYLRIRELEVLMEVVHAHEEVLELPAQDGEHVRVADAGGQLNKVLAHPLEELRVFAAQRREGFLSDPWV